MLKRFTVLSTLLLLLAACHSDPYEDVSGSLGPNPPAPQEKTGQLGPKIKVDPILDMFEGEVGTFTVGLEASGTPMFTFDGKPEGADYNFATREFKWTPPIGSSQQQVGQGLPGRFPMLVRLSSRESPDVKTEQKTVIIVRRRTHGLDFGTFETQAQIREGTPYEVMVKLVSREFPRGPFTISAGNLPSGVNFAVTGDPTQFKLTYHPNFRAVTTSSPELKCYNQGRAHMCMKVPWTLRAVDPNGATATRQAVWTVLDIRQQAAATVLGTPRGDASTKIADFYVQVEDRNHEVPPEVTIANVPNGTATAETVSKSTGSDSINPFSLVHVVWKASQTATGTMTMNLKSCVYDDESQLNTCQSNPVEVQF